MRKMNDETRNLTAWLILLLSASGHAFMPSSLRPRRRSVMMPAISIDRDTFNETSPTLDIEDHKSSMMTDDEIVDNISHQMKDFISGVDDLMDLQQDVDLNLADMEEDEHDDDQAFMILEDGEDEEEDPILKQLEENLLATIAVLEDTLQETQIMNELETMELKDQNQLLQKDLEEQKLLTNQAMAQLEVERIVLEKQLRTEKNDESSSELPKNHYESWSPAMVTMILQSQQEQHAQQLKDMEANLEQEREERKLAEAQVQKQLESAVAAAVAESSTDDEKMQKTIQKQQDLLDIANQKITKLDQDLSTSKQELESQKEVAKDQKVTADKRELELKGIVTQLEKDKRNLDAVNTKTKSSLAQLQSSQDQLETAVQKAQGESKEAKKSVAAANQELAKTRRSLAESMAQVSRLDTRLARIQKQRQQKKDWEKQRQEKLREKQMLERKQQQEKIEQQRLAEKKRAVAASVASKSAYQSSSVSGGSDGKSSSPAVAKASVVIPRLDNWELTSSGEVQGSVYNHPSLPNGEPIRTSMLVNSRIAKDGAVVKTQSGTAYRLGKAKRSAVSADPKSKSKSGMNLFGGVAAPAPSLRYKQQQRQQQQQAASPQEEQTSAAKRTPSTFSDLFGASGSKKEDETEVAEEKAAPSLKQPSIPAINLFGSVNKKVAENEETEEEEEAAAAPPKKTPAVPLARMNFFGTNNKKEDAVETKEDIGEEKTTPATPKIQPLSLNFFGSSQKSEKKAKIEEVKDEASVESPVSIPSYGNYRKAPPKKQEASEPAELDLTGTTIMNGKYLLAGKSKRSVTGRCLIMGAYRADSDNEPAGKPLIIKLSENGKAMKKEHSIYKKVISGVNRGVIVKCLEYVPEVEDRPGKSALVLERGVRDLKEHRKWNGFDEEELRQALHSVNQCMECMHSARMVWTDLKTENFVMVEDDKGEHHVKAIDLESAMKIKDNPIDYTPEATPPEFAKEFLSGDPREFVLDCSFDVWSYGMLAYEIATGVGFFDGNSPDAIMQKLSRHDIPNTSIGIEDDDLADLISQCLSVDPKQRPSAQKISRHPYFSSVAKPGGIFSLW